MNFNFNTTESAVSTSANYLAPWDIYQVQFKGFETDEFANKSGGDPYKVLRINFEGEKGVHSEVIFFPNEKSFERGTNMNGKPMPSGWETISSTINQILAVLCPEVMDKFKTAASKCKTFDQVCDVLKKLTKGAIGKETNLKLIGRTSKDGYVSARLPYFLGINKQGELFVSNNFIGDNLSWSSYEQGQKEKFLQTKPTSTKEVEETFKTVDESTSTDSDEDLDDLLAGL